MLRPAPQPRSTRFESIRAFHQLAGVSNARGAIWWSPAGDLGVTFEPAGFPDGYQRLVPGAHAHTIGDIRVKVAGLDDVINTARACEHENAGLLGEVLNRLQWPASKLARLHRWRHTGAEFDERDRGISASPTTLLPSTAGRSGHEEPGKDARNDRITRDFPYHAGSAE